MSAILAGRYFTINRVLSRSGVALSRVWPVFLLVTLLIGLPELYLIQLIDTQFERDTWSSLLIGSFGPALLDGVGIGWLTAAVLAAEAGQKPSPGSTLRRALPAWAALVPVLGVSNFSWYALFIQSSIWRGGVGLVAVMLVAVALWVYMPVVVAERQGIAAGLRRGLFLVTGHFWRIVLLVVLYLVAYVGLSGISWGVLPYGLRADFTVVDYGGSLSLAGLSSILVGQLGAVLAAVSYVLLRNDKDGVPVEEVAPVFD